MTIKVLRAVLFCLLVPAAVALAEDNPLSANSRGTYAGVKKILLRAAEKMPEESYGFRPTDEVRTFGQIVGHVADAQYAFCSVALGEKNPGLNIEKTKSSKAELIGALKEAFIYCDKAYDGLTDATAAQTVKFMGGPTPKLGVLSVNQIHTVEHYGNLVTYMRMRNIVPPTSDPEFMKSLRR
jgi:uncharacterized damage-inducible protein DinB